MRHAMRGRPVATGGSAGLSAAPVGIAGAYGIEGCGCERPAIDRAGFAPGGMRRDRTALPCLGASRLAGRSDPPTAPVPDPPECAQGRDTGGIPGWIVRGEGLRVAVSIRGDAPPAQEAPEALPSLWPGAMIAQIDTPRRRYGANATPGKGKGTLPGSSALEAIVARSGGGGPRNRPKSGGCGGSEAVESPLTHDPDPRKGTGTPE